MGPPSLWVLPMEVDDETVVTTGTGADDVRRNTARRSLTAPNLTGMVGVQRGWRVKRGRMVRPTSQPWRG